MHKVDDLLALLGRLVAFKTVTPNDDGCLDFVGKYLQDLGFECQFKKFDDVNNLYAKLNVPNTRNLCFAGHVDVVPPGDIASWIHDPFKMIVKDDLVFGRGVVDMKGAIACFLHALRRFLETDKLKHSISLLLTGDEEAIAKNGTNKMIKYLSEQGEKIDYCLIGEMTCKHRVCDCIKIGRRGSVNFMLEIAGVQGHVAYPELIDNPVHRLSFILSDLAKISLDEGSAYFEPSSLQIVDFSSNNQAVNICPSKAVAKFNIRYNDNFDPQKLYDVVYQICIKYADIKQFKLTYPDWNASYYKSKKADFADLISDIVEESLGYKPVIDTTGGATDGRFIAKYCDNIAELGINEKTAHKVDEHCTINELNTLERVYFNIIKKIQQ